MFEKRIKLEYVHLNTGENIMTCDDMRSKRHKLIITKAGSVDYMRIGYQLFGRSIVTIRLNESESGLCV